MDPRAIAGKAEEEDEPQSCSWEGRRRWTPELQLGRQKKMDPRAIAGKAEEEEPQSYSWEGGRR